MRREGLTADGILGNTVRIVREELGTELGTELGGELGAIRVERAVVGLFFTGVKLSTGHAGACATPIKEIPEAVCCPSSAMAMPFPGKLAGRRAADLLAEAVEATGIRRALGIATLNALAEIVAERRGGAGCEIVEGSTPSTPPRSGRRKPRSSSGPSVRSCARSASSGPGTGCSRRIPPR